MDTHTHVYLLFRCLKGMPGFAYRPNGLFEYWGVPLHAIPMDWASVDLALPRHHEYMTVAQANHVVRIVDRWLADRHLDLVVQEQD